MLQARHADRNRYAVVEALIRPSLERDDDDAPIVRGSIVGLTVGRVHVPPSLGRSLAPFRPTESRRQTAEREREEARSGWPAPTPPRYRADLVFGRRYEPWLAGVASSGEPKGS